MKPKQKATKTRAKTKTKSAKAAPKIQARNNGSAQLRAVPRPSAPSGRVAPPLAANNRSGFERRGVERTNDAADIHSIDLLEAGRKPTMREAEIAVEGGGRYVYGII